MGESVWKWLTAATFAITISLGGYIWQGLAEQLADIENQAVKLEVDLAQEKVRNFVQYQEIERRLGNIEGSLRRMEETTVRHWK